jgi:hypothetical protein
MFNSRLLFVSALMSFSALGAVSFQEKKDRLEYLEELSRKTGSIDIKAYRRELEYEKQDMPLENRAENEANLLAETIKVQVLKLYESALENMSAEEAKEEVRQAIEKDLELAAPELREEIRKLSLDALENAQLGNMSSDGDLNNVQNLMLEEVKDRSAFLNQEGIKPSFGPQTMILVNPDNDAERREYSSKAEVLESLISNRRSANWIWTSTTSMKSAIQTKRETKVSHQVKLPFLGMEISGGPSILFRRTYYTNAHINAEGISSPVLSDGDSFDFPRRDCSKPLEDDQAEKRRPINFSCETVLEFETDYTGGGGFSLAGVGGSRYYSKVFTHSVTHSSRRILVPDCIGGRTVRLSDITNLCHESYLNTRVKYNNSNMTVADSLNATMKNVIAGLRFSHPKTKCAVDDHCSNWFHSEVAGIFKNKNFPRCIEEKKEKYRTCELRGLKGQNCAVFDAKGKRLSDGMFEFRCDKGLKCVKSQDEGWFRGGEIYQYAEGRCMPINSRTYRSP